MPRKYVHKKRGKTLNYSSQQLADALQACQNGLSVREASRAHNVPKSTLADRVSGRYELNVAHGRPCAMPAEVEKKIVDTVKVAAERGIGISRKQLLLRANVLCQRIQVHSSYTNFKAGKNWWEGLRKRHGLTLRKPERLGSTRARMMNRQVVGKYFDALSETVHNLNLQDKPQFIWNCDETGKNFEHNPIKVVAAVGASNVVSKTSPKSTNITIMACVNAGGKAMPPMFVVKGKTKRSLYPFNTKAAPKGTKWAFQEKGWMTDDIGEQWFNHVFLENCGPHRPQLLVLDGHSSHESLAILQRAIEENIYIMALPPHTTHHLQPLDKAVFGPFNKAYNTACSEFLQNPLNTVNKWTFPALITMAWESSLTEGNIKSGFSACGIYPVNRQAIPLEAFAPSKPTDVSVSCQETSAESQSPTESSEIPQVDLSVSDQSVDVAPSIEVSYSDAVSEVLMDPAAVLDLIARGDFIVEGEIDTSNLSADLSLTGDLQLCQSAPTTPIQSNSQMSSVTHMVTPVPTLSETPVTYMSVSSENERISVINQSPPVWSLPVSNCNSIEQAHTSVEHSKCMANWNKEIEDLFLPPVPCKKAQTSKGQKRSLTSHRLLTSDEIIKEKINVENKKALKKAKEGSRKRKIKQEN